MEYIIGVLMSVSFPLGLALVGFFFTLFIFKKTGSEFVKLILKVYCAFIIPMIVIAGLIYPSNTHKVKADKLPNPIINTDKGEIQITTPLSEVGKEDRAKKFDDSVNGWKNN